MGLTSIHHPNALHHFNGVMHCPWCGKEGQNEGTVVNHLWMTHYKLGLVCKKCFCCPSVISEAVGHHGCKSCQPFIGGGPNKPSSLTYPQCKVCQTNITKQRHIKDVDLNGGLDGGLDICKTDISGIHPLYQQSLWSEPQPRSH